MGGFRIDQNDVALDTWAKSILSQKYVVCAPDTSGAYDKNPIIGSVEKKSDPALPAEGAALQALNDLEVAFEKCDANSIRVLDQEKKIASIGNGDNKAKMILLGKAAEKVQETVRAHVGIFARILLWIKSCIICCTTSAYHDLDNKASALIAKCQAAYDEIIAKAKAEEKKIVKDVTKEEKKLEAGTITK